MPRLWNTWVFAIAAVAASCGNNRPSGNAPDDPNARAIATFRKLDTHVARRHGVLYALAHDKVDVVVTTKLVDVCRDFTCADGECRWLEERDYPDSVVAKRERGDEARGAGFRESIYQPCPGALAVTAPGQPLSLAVASLGNAPAAQLDVTTGADGAARLPGLAAQVALAGQALAGDTSLGIRVPGAIAQRTEDDRPEPSDLSGAIPDKLVVAGGVMRYNVWRDDQIVDRAPAVTVFALGPADRKTPLAVSIYASNVAPTTLAGWPEFLASAVCTQSTVWYPAKECDRFRTAPAPAPVANGNTCCAATAGPSAPAGNGGGRSAACLTACQGQSDVCWSRCQLTYSANIADHMDAFNLCTEQCNANDNTCTAACR